HEIVDVYRMMLVAPAADDRHDAAVDQPEELRKPPVPGAVRLGDPHDRPAEPAAAPRNLALGLELRLRVDVLRPGGRRLVEAPVAGRAVDADRAAVNEALDARFFARVEQITRPVDVHRPEIPGTDVRLVLRRREMEHGVR